MKGLTFLKPTILALPMGLPFPSKASEILWSCIADAVHLQPKHRGPTRIRAQKPDSIAGPLEFNVFAS